MQSDWKIVKRSFKALKYQKGSPQRYKLNKSSHTSEFARHKKFLVVDENNKPLKSFETKHECMDFIQNPDKYRPRVPVHKYTARNLSSGLKWYYKKRKNYA